MKLAVAVMLASGLLSLPASGLAAPASGALSHCAGMEPAQDGAPKENGPRFKDGAPLQDRARPPARGPGAGKGEKRNVTPPDRPAPPGCIFQNEPLELLV